MKGKRVEKMYFDELETPIGTVYLTFSAGNLTAIDFEAPHNIIRKKSAASLSAKGQLAEYFEGKRRTFTSPTEFVTGTPFEKLVWRALNEVPYGETRTYKWLAGRVGTRGFRAVGRALGKNPLPIIFPCHRIIEADGSLGGYSSGLDIKRRLLKLEFYRSSNHTE